MESLNVTKHRLYADYAKQALEAWTKAEGKLTPTDSNLSAKGKKLAKLLPSFGCNARQVGDVLSVLLDEKIETNGDTAPHGAFVVYSSYTMLVTHKADDGTARCCFVGSSGLNVDQGIPSLADGSGCVLATVDQAKALVAKLEALAEKQT